MRTIKSLAMEPRRRRDWEDRSAKAVDIHFRVGKISMTASTLMGFLEKAMLVTVIAVGAHEVFDQTITVGALIAFQMLSGRVVSPLVAIVSLVTGWTLTLGIDVKSTVLLVLSLMVATLSTLP